MTAPAYGVLRRVSDTAAVLLENNPSTMTLEGTNSWVLRAPDAPAAVVVDPGYRDLDHLEKLAAVGAVELILLTHHHPDHAEGAPWLAERTGAPVRAFDATLCIGAAPFTDGDVLTAAGLEIRVLHTPGHTDDSVSLHVADQLLTGDTILGRGTTVLHDLGDYLRSLRKLIALPAGTPGLPGHGPELPDLPTTAREYLAHREQRLDQVRSALRTLGEDATPRQVVEVVYADVDRALWAPAEASVRAQLDYLRTSEGDG
ncbi:MBL fold metallo-hydrolase [Amycolatopsis jejuensis]|uniref:MBL fold metallo-hydrolase n=1 Tax=Amycolatopsis jejuensis TaxID=330084 RepID=UPI000526EAA8|nr:MBL fold metallo-hydrolase [Amycolatopsis jejuensis]